MEKNNTVVGDISNEILPPQTSNPALELSKQKLAIMRGPILVLPARSPNLSNHKHCLLRELYERENLHLCSSFSEQIFVLHQSVQAHASAGQEWTISFAELGLFFGFTRQYVRMMILNWNKMMDGDRLAMRGRPNGLSSTQVERVLSYVAECDAKLVPLTQIALLKWINSTFDLSLSHGWMRMFLGAEKSLFLVDAHPIESARGKLEEGTLSENAKILAEKTAIAHPELVMNCDETGLDCKKELSMLKVVSRRQCPRVYCADRGDSHITFLVTAGITGWTLPHLAIIKTMSVVSDLSARYGFPKSSWAHIVSSTSAYINEKLFDYYIDEILVPGVQARRRMLGLIEANALLILDGCLCHKEEKLKALSQHQIFYHFLPPHSSHITQPLDRGLFSYHKRVFKNTQCDDTKNKVGRRLMRGLIALSSVCVFSNLRSSFWRAGMELNYNEGKPLIHINSQTWLIQLRSPNSELKEEHFVDETLKKRKRVKTVMKGLTKKEMAQDSKKRKVAVPTASLVEKPPIPLAPILPTVLALTLMEKDNNK